LPKVWCLSKQIKIFCFYLILSNFKIVKSFEISDRTSSVNYSTVFNSKVHGCFKLFEQLSKRFDLLYVFSKWYFHCCKYRSFITVYQKQIMDEII
jgi:hypothetical protein